MRGTIFLLRAIVLAITLSAWSESHAQVLENFFKKFHFWRKGGSDTCKVDEKTQANLKNLERELEEEKKKLQKNEVTLQKLKNRDSDVQKITENDPLKGNSEKSADRELLSPEEQKLQAENETLRNELKTKEANILHWENEKKKRTEELAKIKKETEYLNQEMEDYSNKKYLAKQVNPIQILGFPEPKISDEKDPAAVNAYFDGMKKTFFEEDGNYTAYSKSILNEKDKAKRDALLAIQFLFFPEDVFVSDNIYETDADQARHLSKLHNRNVTTNHVKALWARLNGPEMYREWMKNLMNQFPKKLVIDLYDPYNEARMGPSREFVMKNYKNAE